MAPRTSKPVEEITDLTEEDDFVIDDGDDELTETEPHAEPLEYSGLPEEPALAPAPPQSVQTTTQSFMNPRPMTVDSIEDLGVELVDPEAESFIVRVWTEVGPIFYGQEEVHLLKNRRYRVKPHIYEYLVERNLLWEQQEIADVNA